MPTSKATPTFRDLLRDPTLMLAFGFGSGLSPKAPGTAGSLLAIALYPLLATLPANTYWVILGITIIVGIAVCGRAADKLGVHDHGGIVLDEIAGVWVTMSTFPATWPWLVAGFVLFRIFDIWKPWPIRLLDRRVHGGLGIMLDDLLAGGLAWLLLFMAREVLG
ncbi:MAG: phosphatidylglycerophosphatase A [Porticoccaceae bacterium]|nr:phosphatidylglycerophosphatase A [Porticoccaceae bacterium]